MSAAGYELRGIYGTEPYWPEKKLKICVTGAGGFIASHLAKRLKEEGHHVVGCDWKRNEHMPVRSPKSWKASLAAISPRDPFPRATATREGSSRRRRRRAFSTTVWIERPLQ
jgi:NAD(P)-dependent dehydrogenase (short-subunit alcohol dehydrogenase family)